MSPQWRNCLVVDVLLLLVCVLCVKDVYGASLALDRHSRYIPVDASVFNCSGIPDGYFVHPSSCSIFYACVGGQAYKSECLPGLLYHQSTTYCEKDELVNCSRVTLPTTTTPRPTTTETTSRRPTTTETTTRIPTTTMTTRGLSQTTRAPVHHADCSGKTVGTLIRNPSDCTKYFECTATATVPFVCPGNTVFSEKIHGCDYRYNVPECKV